MKRRIYLKSKALLKKAYKITLNSHRIGYWQNAALWEWHCIRVSWQHHKVMAPILRLWPSGELFSLLTPNTSTFLPIYSGKCAPFTANIKFSWAWHTPLFQWVHYNFFAKLEIIYVCTVTMTRLVIQLCRFRSKTCHTLISVNYCINVLASNLADNMRAAAIFSTDKTSNYCKSLKPQTDIIECPQSLYKSNIWPLKIKLQDNLFFQTC